ncbi:MAG: FemAB family XrtA/PEP-CTERM system-associated protein [Candidatus Acidiferrales bacterium]|jgi:FemAB-related protein (PEP-CTERM system-associated)
MATCEFPAALHLPARASGNAAPVRVIPFQESAAPAWDSFVLADPKGTFFHQIAWKRVMEKTYGYRPLYYYSERGGRITGIAPVFLVASWITGRCLISLPFAVYGGICAEDAETEQALLKHMEQLAAELRVEYLELRNRDGGLVAGYHPNPRYATFTIPLDADTDALYRALPKDIRYMIRRAEKAGLTARHGLDQQDVFYDLMTVNLRRLGTPAFPRSLFENLIHEYPGQVDLQIIYSASSPLAGGMTFFFRNSAQPYYVGATSQAKSVAANDFLWWQMIKTAAETGRTEFDFGRSKIGSGNYDFKKKWKPRIEPLDYQVKLVRRKTVPNFSPANPKFEMATNIWKKVPLGLTRVIGPRVVRWFP